MENRRCKGHVCRGEPGKRLEVEQFRPQSPLFFWPAPRTRTLNTVPKQGVGESQTSGTSTQTQKFETVVVVNDYKNRPSMRLRINWKWPESVFLLVTKRKANCSYGYEIVCMVT